MSFVAFVLRLLLVPSVAAAAPASVCRAMFQAPVTGAVIDPYRPPACRWCPGNRGIDYATRPGELVRAAADGVIGFAGPVAGRLVVVVDHAGGLRTTYDGVAALVGSEGASVRTGDPVGVASDRLHFGVRRGDAYLDPGPLLVVTCPRPRLVPLEGTHG